MRSGFLNASSSDSLTVYMDKGSRNKRKFRIDQQQHSAAPLIPPSMCASNSEGCKNSSHVADACSGRAVDPQSNCVSDCAASSPSTIGCCSTVQNSISPDLITYPSSHFGLMNTTVSPYGGLELPPSFQQFPFPSDGQDYVELQQSWDRSSETQLEAILMSMLDSLYKDALKKIVSFNFSEEEALSAVLRKGRWSKRDAVTSIVENALAWLQNREARSGTTEFVFPALKDLKGYVLAEMISMLRKVRPYLNKGDCMWRLLMCDLNVLLACTMDEDSVPLASKEGITPNTMLSQTMQPTEMPPATGISGGTAAVVPPSQQAPRLPQSNTHSSTTLISSHKESRSAFSTPSFSFSPVGKVAIASRKGVSSKPSLSTPAQTFTASLTMESTNAQKPVNCFNLNSAVYGQTHQGVCSVKSPQLPQFAALEDHTMKLGLYLSNPNDGLEKCCYLNPDYLVQRVFSSDASPSCSREVQTAGLSVPCMPQSSETHNKNYSIERSTSFQPGATGIRPKGGKLYCSSIVLPDDCRQPGQTGLQIGNTKCIPTYDLPQDESWTTSSNSCNLGSLASSGANLSLATTSTAVRAVSTEFSVDCQVDSCTDEHVVACSKASVPVGQMLSCIDSTAEEQKTVMLWQLVDRVKYLEAQLQEWTDWAQQKIMQAARRLTKDTSELKALRQERDEYIRLKREKQALEESTMKKLAEMENSLGKALSQVDRANSTASRIESENAQVRAELEAAKLTAAESVYFCQEASKREKKSIKKAQGWEKQKSKLPEELSEGKRNLSSLVYEIAQAKKQLQQAEVRWRREKKAKEEAQVIAEAERQAKESGEHSVKKRDEALKRKSEALSQKYRQEVQKLESDISKIKLSMGLQPSVLSWGSSYKMESANLEMCSVVKLKEINARLQSAIVDLRQSSGDMHRNRECVMCMNEDMSVVFLPCAHQVVCVKCNDLHHRKGLRDCPSCRTPIQQRVRVYGVRP